MTRTSLQRLLKLIGVGLVALAIVAFAVWRSLSYVRGPLIVVIEPSNGSMINERSVMIRGHIERATNLLLNGNKTNIDEQGQFSEVAIIFPGVNLITLKAEDQFGRSVEDRLTLIGSVGNNIATSTSLVR